MGTLEKGFYAGFSRVTITPPIGIGICGYAFMRYADGVLDDLEVNTLALSKDGQRVLIMVMDICEAEQRELDKLRLAVSQAVEIPADAIFLSATHTHTSPVITEHGEGELEKLYFYNLREKLILSAIQAVADLKPARMGWAVGHVPYISNCRRFRMKDGSVRTNPGIGNSDIAEPLAVMDESMNVLRFDREGAESLVLVNFGGHPDAIGGNKISADWPGFARRTFESCVPDARCIFLNGAQGDAGHLSVWAKDGEFNDLKKDFDDVYRSYSFARRKGRILAGSVLQEYDIVSYVDVDSIRFAQKMIKVPSNMPTAKELVQAHQIHALHMAGRDDEIPLEGMLRTTAIFEAERMVRLEHGPESFDLRLSAITVGPVAFLGVPGEPFSKVGQMIKQIEGFKMVCPASLTNGGEGYFPTRDAFAEGGYEVQSCIFKAGTAEQIVKEGRALLAQLIAKGS